MVLITRFETTSRAWLWSPVAQNKYRPAVDLESMTGMPRQIFNNLWSTLRWSHQPNDRPDGLSYTEHRWMLIDDMVDIFHRHREEAFVPSEWICVDESILRWYGLGGKWINIGLPMCIAIDRKPDSGYEIQKSACDRSGIMMMIRFWTNIFIIRSIIMGCFDKYIV